MIDRNNMAPGLVGGSRRQQMDKDPAATKQRPGSGIQNRRCNSGVGACDLCWADADADADADDGTG
jgi:hypothetical protein